MRKSIIYSLLFILLSGTIHTSCNTSRTGNNAVDKRKKKMGKRKMKKTELGCPMKDC